MKHLILLLFIGVQMNGYSQVITLKLSNQNIKRDQEYKITKETKKIIVDILNDQSEITAQVDTIPVDSIIIIYDDKNQVLGKFEQQKEIKIKTKSDFISNKTIKIVIKSKDGKEKHFTSVLIQNLPKSELNIEEIVTLLGSSDDICEPCKYNNRQSVYNFATNSLEYKNIYNWKKLKFIEKRRPIVGKPYTFSVINFNPFRDSVIIGSTTTNFNTEVPDLFSQAFFSFRFENAIDKGQINKLLSDVFTLGQKIKTISAILKDLKECEDICSIITNVTSEIETHFIKNYSFNKAEESLIGFISRQLNEIREPIYRDSITTILNEYRNFYTSRNYFNYQIPKVQNVDEYIFNLSIIPKKGATSNTVVNNQPISINTVGGFKMDFSTGLFLTRLKDQRFNLRPDSTVIFKINGQDSIVFNKRNQIVQQTNENDLDFGIAALMHVYPRITPYVNLSLSIGAGLSIGPSPSIRYLGGASLLLGKSGRFVISSGWAAGYVDVLANGYENDQFVALNDIKNITKKTLKTNSFFAVTFNIPFSASKVDAGGGKETVQEEEPKTEEPKKVEEAKS